MNAVLQTARLTLRPIQDGDANLLWPGTAAPEVSRYMAWEPHASLAQTQALVKQEVARWGEQRGMTWVILEDGRFCGIVSLIGLMRTHRALRYDKAELAYWILPAVRGRGIMTEAGLAAMQFAFSELQLHKLCVSHFEVNDDSKRLILRLGFRHVGKQLAEFQKAGVWHNHVLYELLAEEFQQRLPAPDDRRCK